MAKPLAGYSGLLPQAALFILGGSSARNGEPKRTLESDWMGKCPRFYVDIIKDITDIGGGIWKAPAWVLLVLALNLLGLFLHTSKVFPSRYNQFIGVLLAVLGMILTPLIVPASIFPPEQPHPKLLLVIVGFIFGMAAWFFHKTFFQWVANKYFPAEMNKQPETK